jgi:hypothetical protein
MPRKKNVIPEDKKTKKNLINTMFKENVDNEHIILQLPISQTRINSIINSNNENAIINEPTPYESNSYFMNDAENIVSDKKENNLTLYNNNNSCCYWCCHSIEQTLYGMPVNYDSINDTYLMYGSFCSLQCANAYNFSINCGSDKVWEINSWIQMLGKRYGYINYIRPSPSKYLLKMFGGSLSIDEFRKCHDNNEKTYILNIPPMISLNTNMEILNTSYLTKITDIKEKSKIDFKNKKGIV